MPLFVNATAGSTVYGAFDPINEIADICEKYNLWLHVDVSAEFQKPPRQQRRPLCPPEGTPSCRERGAADC